MIKLMLLSLLTIATSSVFAEPFSAAKFKSLKTYKEQINYCKTAQISAQSNVTHMAYYFRTLRSKQPNISEADLNKEIAKFSIINEVYFKNTLGIVYGYFGLVDKVIEQYKITNNPDLISNLVTYMWHHYNKDEALKIGQTYKQSSGQIKIRLANFYFQKRDYKKLWDISCEILLTIGGIDKPKTANDILLKMFRYKPASITKEQQIEFLKQIAQIYPIPGTDFNAWKGFMGFVGFKYKQLTGTDLFATK